MQQCLCLTLGLPKFGAGPTPCAGCLDPLSTHPSPTFHPNRWWWCTACSILAVGLPILGRGNCERRRWMVAFLYNHSLTCPSHCEVCSGSAPCTAVVHAVYYCCMFWSVWHMYTVQCTVYYIQQWKAACTAHSVRTYLSVFNIYLVKYTVFESCQLES